MGLRVLHLGCGHAKLPGAVGVDVLAFPEVDVVHDLDRAPWPFAADAFDVVVAHAVVEHLDDIVSAMEEMWRVTKDNGSIVINVPYFRHTDAFGDPTHRRYFTSQSMDVFLSESRPGAQYEYTKAHFALKGFWYGWPQESERALVRAFKRFIHTHKRLYDQYLSLLVLVKIVTWELMVKKVSNSNHQ